MWRLRCERGRQWWDFDENVCPTSTEAAEVAAARVSFAKTRFSAAHSSDQILRAQAAAGALTDNPAGGVTAPVPEHLQKSRNPIEIALHKGMAFFSTLQMGDGHWPGDYGGPMFLMPGLIIAARITRTDLGIEVQREMTRYLRNHQNPDGGYGLHIEHHSIMFTTALSYVSMRILGAGADDAACVAARAWIEKHGGAGGVPGWGKFWLSVLGVYDWEGVDPLTPEFWLIPYALPIHPARMWCHCRQVYLPMSHLYGKRAVGPLDELVLALREELYGEPYADVVWKKQRGRCCPLDVYTERPRWQRALWELLVVFEKVSFPGKTYLRRRALEETLELVRSEDENTCFIDIGPVNKAINFLCCWFDDPESDDVKLHAARLKDYLWLAEDGMKMQGYNGSQLWDTAFAAQAFTAAGEEMARPFVKSLSRAHYYVDITQVRNDVREKERYYRHQSKGAWPFSTRDHGWPIADCTGEGLKAALCLQKAVWIPKETPIADDRLEDAIEMILSYQNYDGGWATYELSRGPEWLELLNPSETFGDIMIDYSYVECSSSSITALTAFRKLYPTHRRTEVDASIRRGIDYIKSIQKEDGSWYGSWGVCFLYAIWFGVEALISSGERLETSFAVRGACEFVIRMQREDGSWGESYKSCQDKVYTQSETGQVVSTSWALLVLALARWKDHEPIQRGLGFLLKMQEPSGDWPQQLICGVFNRNCMISYSQFRNIFPIWAIAECRNLLGNAATSLIASSS
jgi:cycloartenol synthase